MASSLRHMTPGYTRLAFVGRARELRELQAERQRSTLGRLRVALVLGAPGMGKTRLTAELLRKDERVLALCAHSSPLRRTPPFTRWTATLSQHAANVDAGAICRACEAGSGDASTRFHHRMVEPLVGLLAQVSADRPVVVVLDDVHCADEALWEMLLHLSQDHPHARLFVIATARPEELGSHRVAAEALLALEQESVIHEIQLRPLAREDIRELAGAIVGQDNVPPVLVDWLMTRSQGNPRFTVGLLQALVEEGADLHAPGLCKVPEGLARWIRAEVMRLAPSTSTLLELLATVGGLTDPDDLAHIADQPVENVAVALEQLVRSGMAVEQEHNRSLGYKVAHPFIREVLYARIGGARRRAWHRRAAETFLQSGRAEAAALHFARSARAGDNDTTTESNEAIRQVQQAGCEHEARMAALESTGQRTTNAMSGPTSLTKREREVAELAARGYTARQIAGRLHIGTRTVETHLARIYPKLGVTSKQQLIYHGTELGLAP
jgi:DNA-binding CsgD family transcriptional regulator